MAIFRFACGEHPAVGIKRKSTTPEAGDSGMARIVQHARLYSGPQKAKLKNIY